MSLKMSIPDRSAANIMGRPWDDEEEERWVKTLTKRRKEELKQAESQ